MPGKIILVAGFPGSGKTWYGKRLKDELGAAGFIDDYHDKAVDDNPAFDHGRCYIALIEGLRRDELWIAADIEWCYAHKRTAVDAALREVVPDVDIEWHFKESNAEVCKQRVQAERPSARVEQELRKIDELARVYAMPATAKIIPIAD